jgi:hypothetical protein
MLVSVSLSIYNLCSTNTTLQIENVYGVQHVPVLKLRIKFKKNPVSEMCSYNHSLPFPKTIIGVYANAL